MLRTATPNQLPLPLTSIRLVLRKPELTDAKLLFAAYTHDPKVTVYTTWKPHQDVNETKKFLAACIQRWDAGQEYNVIIETRTTHQVIGMAKVKFLTKTRAQLGYVIAAPHWGQGFATETVSLLLSTLFKNGITNITAFCDVDNQASIRVMEKAGLHFVKRLPNHVLHPNLSTQKRDCLLFEITNSTS